MSAGRVAVAAVFATALVAAGVLEWRARRPGSRVPRFGDLVAAALAYRVGRVPVGRIAVLALWWWIGWHFFAR
jgi:hypothetical protein